MTYISPYYNALQQNRRIQSQRMGSARPTQSQRAEVAPTSDDMLNNFDYGQLANWGSAGVAGYGQGVGGVQDFSIDPYAGLKGSGQGLAQGGWVGAVIGGVSSQIGQFSEVNRKLKDLNYGVDLYQTGATGEPIYSGAGYLQSEKTSQALKEGENAINGALDPGTRIFGGLFGTEGKLRRARKKMSRARRLAQNEFNDKSATFDEQQNAISDYYNRLNMSDRFYNLYK